MDLIFLNRIFQRVPKIGVDNMHTSGEIAEVRSSFFNNSKEAFYGWQSPSTTKETRRVQQTLSPVYW